MPTLTGISATLGGAAGNAYEADLASAAPGDRVAVGVADSVNGAYLAEAQIEAPREDPTYEWGIATPAGWQEVEDQEEAKVGDRLRFTYKTSVPWFQDWQASALRRLWSLRTDFEVTAVRNFSEQQIITVEGIVRKPFSPVIVVAAAVGAVGVAVALYFSVAKIEKLGERVVEAAGPAFPFLVAGVIGIFLLGAIRK